MDVFRVLFVLGAVCATGFGLTANDCPKFVGVSQDGVRIAANGNVCYYYFLEDTKTFDDASLVCSSRRGKLAMPRDRLAISYLKHMIESYNVSGNKTWVGLLEEKGQEVSRFFWINGENVDTNYAKTITEFADAFTVAIRDGVFDFTKSDNEKKNHYVCQILGEALYPVPPRPGTTHSPTPKPTSIRPTQLGITVTSVKDCPKFEADGNDVTIVSTENNCYYFFMERVVNFETASSVCVNRKGRLAMPRTDELIDFIGKQIRSYDTGERTWVGLMEQVGEEGINYFWATGESADYDKAQKVLAYADAFTISLRNGILDFSESDKEVKNHFVCEVHGDDIGRPIPPDSKDYICPENTLPHDTQCFYFHLTDKKSFSNSAKFCKAKGGTLAIAKTRAIDHFLRDSLENVFTVPQESVWIGLHKPKNGDLPKVWDDGSPVTYTNYRYSFPVWDYYAISATYMWEAFPGAIRHYFICQLAATTITDVGKK